MCPKLMYIPVMKELKNHMMSKQYSKLQQTSLLHPTTASISLPTTTHEQPLAEEYKECCARQRRRVIPTSQKMVSGRTSHKSTGAFVKQSEAITATKYLIFLAQKKICWVECTFIIATLFSRHRATINWYYCCHSFLCRRARPSLLLLITLRKKYLPPPPNSCPAASQPSLVTRMGDETLADPPQHRT